MVQAILLFSLLLSAETWGTPVEPATPCLPFCLECDVLYAYTEKHAVHKLPHSVSCACARKLKEAAQIAGEDELLERATLNPVP